MVKDRWSLRNIYLYVVCLITLVMVIVATVGLVRSAVELAWPDPGYMGTKPLDEKGKPTVSDEEWARQEEAARVTQQRSATLSLVGNVAMLLVAGPLYVYHWRKIELEQGDPPAVTVAPPAPGQPA